YEKIEKYNIINDNDLNEIRENLANFSIKEGKKFYVDRTLATDNEEIYEKLLNFGNYCEILFLKEKIEEEKHIIFVNDEFKIEELIPELILSDFVFNSEEIKKALKIFKLIEKYDEYREFFESIEIPDEIFMINEKFELKDYEKDREILRNFKSEILKINDEINEKILKEVEKRNIKIDALELLKANVIEISEIRPVKEIIKEVVDEKIHEILHKFQIFSVAELSNLFSYTYPNKIDEENVELLIKRKNAEILEKEYEFKVKLAKKLKGIKIKEILEKIFELDKILGIIKFLRENKCTIPKISNCIYFKNARNLMIKNPIPITYKLGKNDSPFISNNKIVILTGANSGGKTTFLKLILQNEILSMCGLPVPAEYGEFEILDEIYFLAKHSGTLGAGAFESTLKEISKILVSNNKKIVLIDELEAITEPGAAAKLIAGFIEILKENNDYAVIVTHLSHEILKNINVDVEILGIVAYGLDENLNLIVDRQPKVGVIGKSTPELIVERLFKITKNERERKIYERILEKMKGNISKI
ncbi:MAG: MutS-related protein, partial [Candidatus Altarchaeaceae archaeon]